jgi:streptogramin lyase
VGNNDIVWLSDFGANAMLRFNPKTGQFTIYKSTSRNARASDSRPARRGVVAGVGGG